MDVYRKRKRQAERSINFTDYEGESETTVEFEDDREEFKPEEQIDYKETQKAVLGFMDELSSPQRMAMMLFYYEQYSLKEIADVMECSIGTVKSRLNKAKQLMRGMVDGYEKKHGVALHALPLFPFFAWAFKNAAETSTVHAAPLAYTATAVKNIAAQQAKEKDGRENSHTKGRRFQIRSLHHRKKSSDHPAESSSEKNSDRSHSNRSRRWNSFRSRICSATKTTGKNRITAGTQEATATDKEEKRNQNATSEDVRSIWKISRGNG